MSGKVTSISSPMFKVHNVGKSYGGSFALSPLSLTIAKGETVALVGPSGSGKTTLLNLLANLIKPNSGELWIDGLQARDLRPGKELSRKVGIMHQQLDLVEQLPVVHNVLAGRLGEWSLGRALLSLFIPQDKELAMKALQRVGLQEKFYERTACLSGGEQQRVALARLLVQQPEAILADEPVSALDPARAEDLLQMLTCFAREDKQTLVASIHTVEYAKRYFSRIIALRNGEIYFDRPSCEVKDSDLKQLYDLKENHNAKAASQLA